ncbi:MAG: GNAT family N-acetyltransferase, partial [Acidobacteriota bacterium]
YGYYLLEGHRAVLAGLTVDPRADRHSVGVPLVEELLSSMWRNATVRRVECQSIPFGLPWLGDYLQTKGFQKYERLFLRRSPQRVQVLEAPSREPLAPPARRGEIAVLPWNTTFLAEGARLMQQAHAGRIDAEMNEFYRSRDGCRALLENILFQRGCGIPILSASFAARRLPTQAFCGFVLVAQISRGHAHVAQVAVSPSTQGQGVGRLLLQHAIRALVGRNFQSVSLMVSQSNQKAFSLYRSLGFRRVLRFPVFSWDR